MINLLRLFPCCHRHGRLQCVILVFYRSPPCHVPILIIRLAFIPIGVVLHFIPTVSISNPGSFKLILQTCCLLHFAGYAFPRRSCVIDSLSGLYPPLLCLVYLLLCKQE